MSSVCVDVSAVRLRALEVRVLSNTVMLDVLLQRWWRDMFLPPRVYAEG